MNRDEKRGEKRKDVLYVRRLEGEERKVVSMWSQRREDEECVWGLGEKAREKRKSGRVGRRVERRGRWIEEVETKEEREGQRMKDSREEDEGQRMKRKRGEKRKRDRGGREQKIGRRSEEEETREEEEGKSRKRGQKRTRDRE